MRLSDVATCVMLVALAASCGGDDPAPPTDAGPTPPARDAAMDAERPGDEDAASPADASPPADAPPPRRDAGPVPCAADVDCDDGDGCTSDACGGSGLCVHALLDADGDGHAASDCGGDDCDDGDALRYPGRAETCDDDDRDEDCDPVTFGVRDGDGDRAPDARCCNVASDGTRSCGTDCDDTRPEVSPTAREICDGLDDDCDGEVDEGVLGTFYPDADGDGYGSADPAAMPVTACFVPEGYAESRDDCDDTVGTGDDVHPGAPDLCDPAMRDEDCDGIPNDPPGGCSCSGAESRPCPLPGACAAGTQQCSDGMWPTDCSIAPTDELCNGADDDCDGTTDEGVTVRCWADGDDDGYAVAAAVATRACPVAGRDSVGGCPSGATNREPLGAAVDCRDDDPAVRPGAVEACNGVDDDCNGVVDDGMRVVCYADADDDGYAALGASSMERCPATGRGAVGGCPVGSTNRAPAAPNLDCADSVAARHPGATELCNMIDDDCDGMTDELLRVTCYPDADDDTYAALGAMGTPVCPAMGRDAVGGCPAGTTNRRPTMAGTDADCADDQQTVHPGALELCNGIDDDCNGMIDDGMRVVCYTDVDGDTYAPMGAAMESQCPSAGRMAVGGCALGWTNRAPVAPDIDCADADPTRHPGAMEICNGQDTDCDGTPDDGVQITCWYDGDRDTFAAVGAMTAMACSCPDQWTTREPTAGYRDCDDADLNQHPGATETCNHEDDDCDGSTDEGLLVTRYVDGDGDGYGAGAGSQRCPSDPGFSDNPNDCDDGLSGVNPGITAYSPTPYYVCTNPTYPERCQSGGSWYCRAVDGSLPCSTYPAATARWDFDCSSTDDRQPAGTATCSTSACGGAGTCGGGGYIYSGSPPCGASVVHVGCGACSGSPGSYTCAAATYSTMPLPCR